MKSIRLVLVLVVIVVAVGTTIYAREAAVKEFRQPPFQYSFPISKEMSSEANQLKDAREKFKKEPTSQYAQVQLATSLISAGKKLGSSESFREAEALARRLIMDGLDSKRIKLILVETLQHRHEFNEAESILAKLEKIRYIDMDCLEVDVRLALARGDFSRAIENAEKFVNLLPRSGSYLLWAQALEGAGSTDEANLKYRKAFRVEDIGDIDGSAYLRGLFARFHFRQGDVREARIILDEALRLNPNSAFLVSLDADLRHAEGDWKGAEGLYLRAFERSHSAVYLIKAAKSRRASGSESRAQEMLIQALDLLRSSPQSFKQNAFEIAWALTEKGGPQELKEALSILDEELKVRFSPDIWWVRVNALKKSGEFETAQRALKEKEQFLKWRVDLAED